MAAGGSAREPFPDRLARLVEARRSNLVLGLDPDPAALWPRAVEAARAVSAEGEPEDAATVAAAAVVAHCAALVDAAGESCVAIKPQLACFERLGAPGWSALRSVCDHAHAAGLLVLADGKRGDIAVTATAYGQALVGAVPTPFGEVAGLGADAFTANPLLGADAIGPLVDAARAAGAAPFVLVRTSNPGAADFQDLELADGERLWERIARRVAEIGDAGRGGPADLADVGAVVGATQPEHLARARELMPRTILLLPGVGAQGGRVEDLAPAFRPHPAAGLVTASRAIAGAAGPGDDPAAAAAKAALTLRETAWKLADS